MANSVLLEKAVMQDYPITLDISVIDRLTDEQFFALCQANRDLRMERNADGTITIMSPSSFRSSYLNGIIFGELLKWNQSYQHGMATESSGGYSLPDSSVLAPDASWISDERLDVLPEGAQDHFLAACPNFVVELASPSDNLPSLRRKMETWIRNGVELGWLIDPKTESVEIYAAGNEPKTVIGFDQSIDGGNILPGFVFDLRLLKK